MPAPQMRITRTGLAAAALAVALVSAGCGGSSGPSAHGPLRGGSFGFGGGSDCTLGHVGQPVSFGDEQFTNHGQATLVLDRVGLRHPRQVRLVGSIAVPGTYGIGVTHTFPPRYSGLPPTWKHRQPVHGFRLAPGKSFQMVLGVAATSARLASSPGMVIYYHDPAGRYVAVDGAQPGGDPLASTSKEPQGPREASPTTPTSSTASTDAAKATGMSCQMASSCSPTRPVRTALRPCASREKT